MNMKRLLSLVAFFATVHASAQQVNPVPDYVFANRMSAGRNTVTDTAAYFSIGPRYGATKGFMPPIVGDTATFSSGKRNGLLIFSVQKNKFLYWDSVRVQWSDMAGSSGSYITGSGITGYVPQFSASTMLDTSSLFTLGNRLGVGTSSFAYNATSTANVELNGTAGGILGFKRNDSARGYLWHTGSDMELANTAAGSISFNTNSATRGSISSAGVWRLHNLAGTGDRVVVASSNGTLSASTSVTGLVDTTTISTRAWRQKGLDSLAALEVSGSGTTNYIPKFTAGSTIGNSQIFDNGTNVGIGTTSSGYKLQVDGATTSGFVTPIVARNPSTNSASATKIGFDGGGTIWGEIGASYNSNDPYLAFFVRANSEKFRITDGGNLWLNTTSGTSYGSYTTFSINNATNGGVLDLLVNNTRTGSMYTGLLGASLNVNAVTSIPLIFQTNNTERLRIFANGRIGVNTTTDAGYQLDVNGTLRSVNGANFATTSGNVGIGTASPSTKMHIVGSATTLGVLRIENSQNRNDVNHGTINIVNTKSYALGNDMGIMFSAYRSDNTEIDPRASIAALVASSFGAHLTFSTRSGPGTSSEKMRITEDGELLINTTSDAGDYKLQVSGNIYNTGSAVLAATSGNVGIGTASPAVKLDVTASGGDIAAFRRTDAGNALVQYTNANTTDDIIHRFRLNAGAGNFYDLRYYGTGGYFGLQYNGNNGLHLTTSSEVLINTTSDAGDYKLQVVGNARVGTGKLDIASNTTFGLGIARSGTSEVAGQIYNSNGILYTGVESSAGGQIFSGSSAYAGVIGTGAAYPLQFAVNNATRATINTNGELLINTTTDNGDFKLQVNGNALISGSIKTANGGSSTAVPWHLGSVVATNVQLDTANYVEVEINGVYYRLAIVTPL